jgi:hypothetical protein
MYFSGMLARVSLLVVLLSLLRFSVTAQAIRGEVVSMDNKKPIAGVTITNIHTSLVVTTAETGSFIIAGSSDQLLEFNKPGFKTARVRIPKGFIPPYFKIIMERGLSPIENRIAAQGNRYDPTADSLRFRELYKHELDFARLSTVEKIQHPFSAMSKRNQEVWRFQDEYYETEKEKYVDRTFSPAVITKFTGLTGDSLRTYMVRFRPTYDQLRSMNDYTFYNYVKMTAHRFRSRITPRNSQ